jgi:transcriptional regulator GlxA family with amidase domain
MPTHSLLPRYVARFDRTKPVIAVVAENAFTELTDYVVPYGVLTESDVAEVFALATSPGPIQMFPSLRIEPQATVAEFDTRFPQGADYVVVPAVHYVEDVALSTWVKEQASKGATIVGICDGVWVLAHAGLLENRKAVGHWYSFERLEKTFRRTEWVRNKRYVADGKVITTTGVTASIPVSIAIVEAIAGRERATRLAETMGIGTWNADHESNRFRLTTNHVLTAIANWTSFWSHEDVGIPISVDVDEVALALVADSWSRTYRSSAFSISSSREPVRTRRGLIILPDRTEDSADALDRIVELPVDTRAVAALDYALKELEDSYGAATADFVALQIEYPRH